MAGPEVVEDTVVEDISEDEAIRQMEEGFLAGPGASKGAVLPVVDEGEGSRSAAATEVPDATAESTTSEVVEGEPEGTAAQAAETPSALTDEKVLELLNTSRTTEELRDGIKKLRDDAFGKLGGLERTLKALQEGLSAPGNDVELDEHFKELADQYPDAAPLIVKGMKQALKNAKSIAITTSQVDPEELVRKILPGIEQTVERKFEQQFIARTLDREHKGWREIVGEPDSPTEFRTWLKSKPNAQEILGSYDVELLSDTLSEFKASKQPKPKPPAPGVSTRQSRLEQAVTPKSQIKPPSPRAKTPEEEMEEGFREGPGGRK